MTKTCGMCRFAKPDLETIKGDALVKCACLHSVYRGCTSSPDGHACKCYEERVK